MNLLQTKIWVSVRMHCTVHVCVCVCVCACKHNLQYGREKGRVMCYNQFHKKETETIR